jgi:cyclophilin family peptidyl-prolyl cis-trans isomerase
MNGSMTGNSKKVKELSSRAGSGPPPKNWADPYRVRFVLTTPQLTNAVKGAGKSTGVGEVVVEINPAWAAKAAARFRVLVEQQLFIGCRFFCVIPGCMAQVGLHGDPRVAVRWLQMPIADDAVREKNTKGRLSFVTNGPNTRTAPFFINLGDNSEPGGSTALSVPCTH